MLGAAEAIRWRSCRVLRELRVWTQAVIEGGEGGDRDATGRSTTGTTALKEARYDRREGVVRYARVAPCTAVDESSCGESGMC